MEDASVNFDNADERQRYIDYVSNLRGRKVIHIESAQYVRSLPLNNYYWGCCLDAIAKHTGHSVDELHEIFVESMLPLVIFRDYQDLTTTNISLEECWVYCLKVRHFFMKFSGIYIPDPENVIRPRHQPWPEADHAKEFEEKS